MKPREKFSIVFVREERPGAWYVEIDGGTSYLTVRAYEGAGRDGGWWLRPTSGWEARSLDRLRPEEERKILAAIAAEKRATKRSRSEERRPPRRVSEIHKDIRYVVFGFRMQHQYTNRAALIRAMEREGIKYLYDFEPQAYHRRELFGQPVFDGIIGPMYDGPGRVRYETPEAYRQASM